MESKVFLLVPRPWWEPLKQSWASLERLHFIRRLATRFVRALDIRKSSFARTFKALYAFLRTVQRNRQRFRNDWISQVSDIFDAWLSFINWKTFEEFQGRLIRRVFAINSDFHNKKTLSSLQKFGVSQKSFRVEMFSEFRWRGRTGGRRGSWPFVDENNRINFSQRIRIPSFRSWEVQLRTMFEWTLLKVEEQFNGPRSALANWA